MKEYPQISMIKIPSACSCNAIYQITPRGARLTGCRAMYTAVETRQTRYGMQDQRLSHSNWPAQWTVATSLPSNWPQSMHDGLGYIEGLASFRVRWPWLHRESGEFLGYLKSALSQSRYPLCRKR